MVGRCSNEEWRHCANRTSSVNLSKRSLAFSWASHLTVLNSVNYGRYNNSLLRPIDLIHHDVR